MKLRSYLPRFKDEGRVIAIFGQARLLKYFDGKYGLCGPRKRPPQGARQNLAGGASPARLSTAIRP